MSTMKQLSMFDTVEIPLLHGYVALIDPCDADLLCRTWRVDTPNKNHKSAYARTHLSSSRNADVSIYLHRMIMARVLGRDLLKGEQVDHINMNGLDNRRCNLRVATQSENNRNIGANKRNTSGYKGVSFFNDMKSERWRAQIHINGKTIHLGLFNSPEDAYKAYCEAAVRLHGEFARLK